VATKLKKRRIEGIKLSQEPQNLVNLAKMAEDIKKIQEALLKQEPGAKGFTESQGAAKNEETKNILRSNFKEFLKDESKKSWIPVKFPSSKKPRNNGEQRRQPPRPRIHQRNSGRTTDLANKNQRNRSRNLHALPKNTRSNLEPTKIQSCQ
jgi:hypothetical protein